MFYSYGPSQACFCYCWPSKEATLPLTSSGLPLPSSSVSIHLKLPPFLAGSSESVTETARWLHRSCCFYLLACYYQGDLGPLIGLLFGQDTKSWFTTDPGATLGVLFLNRAYGSAKGFVSRPILLLIWRTSSPCCFLSSFMSSTCLTLICGIGP